MSLPGSAGGTLGTATFMATPQTVLFDEHSWERIPFGSGRVGILGASGPMPEGYHQDQAATAATFRTIDGIRYAVPGDFAIIDADGRVQLLGRGSVCINTGGEKVYPEEVEVAARTIQGIIDCVAVGIADRRYGEIVSLVAERRDNSVSEDDVIAAIRSQLAPYKAPRRVVFVDQVYRSPSGKADYRWAQSVVTGANS
jgi:fatty-acyl-CoA synthase